MRPLKIVIVKDRRDNIKNKRELKDMCNKKRMAAHIVFIKATENCYSIVEDRKDNLNIKEKTIQLKGRGAIFFLLTSLMIVIY